MPESDDETYTVPIAEQRVFGAGIKRKRVAFVPATSTPSSDTAPPSSGPSVAGRYLSIVGLSSERSISAPPSVEHAAAAGPDVPEPPICDVCERVVDQAPRAGPHESSLAHQVCLKHSHGASHIDRSTKGFSYLRAYGWDPDSRKGLGAAGEGRLYPIRPKEKRDTLGLGVEAKKLKTAGGVEKAVRLNAKEVREMEARGTRRKQEMQTLFTAKDDVVRYLGGLG